MRNLQKLLSGSRVARLVAVRRVTQLNQGRYTAGIDGKIYPKDTDKERLVEELRTVDWNNYTCPPVRRVYIPKPGKKEKRPLGIPTMKDRVLQMIVKMALEPEWEARFEQNSFGFRPGRRTMDAICKIHQTITLRKGAISSAWILDADIAKCFDTIDHDALLRRIPVFTSILRRWLKAGAIEFGRLYKTTRGTPQGGVISPLLANIALDGMDRLFGAINSKGKYACPSTRTRENKGVMVVRYADDFVVTAPSKEVILEHVIPKLREFLRERGLALNGAKTRIVHRDTGFDFLGFHVQQCNGKYKKICTVTPSKDRVKYFLDKVKDRLGRNKQATHADIIDKLNPLTKGWAMYYRHCHAWRTFTYVDYRIWWMLWRWCRRRHPGKSLAWIKENYFPQVGRVRWAFADKPGHTLFRSSTVRCGMRKYTMVRGTASPFDPTLQEYWVNRHGNKL